MSIIFDKSEKIKTVIHAYVRIITTFIFIFILSLHADQKKQKKY
jgi:hypothetical protein